MRTTLVGIGVAVAVVNANPATLVVGRCTLEEGAIEGGPAKLSSTCDLSLPGGGSDVQALRAEVAELRVRLAAAEDLIQSMIPSPPALPPFTPPSSPPSPPAPPVMAMKTAFFSGVCNEGKGGAPRFIANQRTGNRRVWTFSAWIKRADTTYSPRSSSEHSGEWETIFGAGRQHSMPYMFVYIPNHKSDFGSCSGYSSGCEGNVVSNIRLRYPGADYGWDWNARPVLHDATQGTRWHHFLYVTDMSLGGADDRNKVFIDGVRLAPAPNGSPNGNTNCGSAAPDCHAPQNTDLPIGDAGREFRIGDFDRFAADGGRNWCFSFNGYMADVRFVNGHALTPPNFGALNDDGKFAPLSTGPTVTLTGNSFHLTFEDASNLGADSSGLGNHFTNYGVTQPSSESIEIKAGMA